MPGSAPTAHSLAEAHLLATVSLCDDCFTRGLLVTESCIAGHGPAAALQLVAECGACAKKTRMVLRIDPNDPASYRSEFVQRIPFVINPTSRASEIIDVAEWLTLYRMAVETAESIRDRSMARAVRIEAGQCVAEALKLFEPDNDVPPDSAFFSAESLERFRAHPDRFARQRLIALANGLPTSMVQPPAPISLNRPPGTKWWMP